MTQGQILSLFPTPLGLYHLKDELLGFERAAIGFEFKSTGSAEANGTRITKSLHVLEPFPAETRVIMGAVEHFVTEALGFQDSKLKITTSWVTETPHGGFSQSHTHLNSLISGVYYFHGTEGSPISFDKPRLERISLGTPSEWNAFNADSYQITPIPGGLILFPSYLSHAVRKQEAHSVRRSLAFNLFPTGCFGADDSSVYDLTFR